MGGVGFAYDTDEVQTCERGEGQGVVREDWRSREAGDGRRETGRQRCQTALEAAGRPTRLAASSELRYPSPVSRLPSPLLSSPLPLRPRSASEIVDAALQLYR